MTLVTLNLPAPDFSLVDVFGNSIALSDFKGLKHVILVLNRGFT
ncbi:MAG TPA: hypothetical protein PKL82_00265 [Anaerolineaceae bacterium]|jgi:peroxiredoxin|nr:hypothetical protein [Anaerolineaceae bacterium]HOG76678.1 hypothetical protein [Anaerolineaceae bacterium]